MDCETEGLFEFEVKGGLLLEIMGLVSLFYCVVVLVDEFLLGEEQVEYLEIVVKRYSLSSEAGGCIIAFGSIVPELAVNTMSLVVAEGHSGLGLSTVIGSGCFGDLYLDFTFCLCVLSVIAGCFWSELSFSLSKVVLNIFLYVACLLYVIYTLVDQNISTFESVILVSMTPIFVFYTFWIRPQQQKDPQSISEQKQLILSTQPQSVTYSNPVKRLFSYFIPRYRGALWQIILSFFLIGLFVFGITKLILILIQRILCHLPIPESMLGLTIIAWGNNIQDVLNASLAVKRGDAQLAVSALLSTQILNLMFSLGLPWSLASALHGNIQIDDQNLVSSLYISVGIVLLAFSILGATRGRFSYKTAVVFGILYIGYVGGEWHLILNQKHLRWIIEGPIWSYSAFVTQAEKPSIEDKIAPPIQGRCFLSGGALTFMSTLLGAKAFTSLQSFSFILGNIVFPPLKTILPKSSLLISGSHFIILLNTSQ